MGACILCNESVDDVDLIEHLRLYHPDEYGDGPETWPDGSVVVIDDTLEPDEFDDGDDA